MLQLIFLASAMQGQPPAASMVSKTVSIAKGTTFRVLEVDPLRAGTNTVKQNVELRLLDDLKDSSGIVVVPKGAMVTGQVRESKNSFWRMGTTTRGRIGLVLKYLVLDDKEPRTLAKISFAAVEGIDDQRCLKTDWNVGASEPDPDDFAKYWDKAKAQALVDTVAKIQGKVMEPKTLTGYIERLAELRGLVCLFYKDLSGTKFCDLIKTGQIKGLDDIVAEYKRAGSLGSFLSKATLGTLMTACMLVESLYDIYKGFKNLIESKNPTIMPGAVFTAELDEPISTEIQVAASQLAISAPNDIVKEIHPLSGRVSVLERSVKLGALLTKPNLIASPARLSVKAKRLENQHHAREVRMQFQAKQRYRNIAPRRVGWPG